MAQAKPAKEKEKHTRLGIPSLLGSQRSPPVSTAESPLSQRHFLYNSNCIGQKHTPRVYDSRFLVLANTAQRAAMPTPLEQGCCCLFLPEVPSTENTKATKKEINQTRHNHLLYSEKIPV